MEDYSTLFDDEEAPTFYRPKTDEPATKPEAPSSSTPVSPPAASSDDDLFADEAAPAYYKPKVEPAAAPAAKPVTMMEDANEALGIIQKGVGQLGSSLGAASQYLNRPLWGEAEPPDPTKLNARLKAWGDEFSKAGEARYTERTKGLNKMSLKDAWKSGNTIDYITLRAFESLPSTVATLAVGAGAGAALRAGAGAAGLAAEALPGVAGSGAFSGATTAGAALGMGDTYQQIADGINQADPAVLAQNSAAFKKDIESGVSVEQAKQNLIDDSGWWQPLAVGMVTGLTSKFGLEEMLAKRAAGELITEGFINGGLKPFLKGAAGEGTQEYLESAAQELAAQTAAVQAGTQKAIDWGKVNANGLEGAAAGAATGGAVGPVLHGGEHSTADTGENVQPPAEVDAPASPKTGEGDKTQSSDAKPEGPGKGADGLGHEQGTPTPSGGEAATSAPPPATGPVVAVPVKTPTSNGKVDSDQGAALAPQPATTEDEEDEDFDIAPDEETGEVATDSDQQAALDALTADEPAEEPEPAAAPTPPVPAQPEGLGTATSGARRAIRRGRGADEVQQIVDSALQKAQAIPAPAGPPTQIGTDIAPDVAALGTQQPAAPITQEPPAVEPLEAAPAATAEAPAAQPTVDTTQPQAPVVEGGQPAPAIAEAAPVAEVPTPAPALAPVEEEEDTFDISPDEGAAALEAIASPEQTVSPADKVKSISRKRSQEATEPEQKEAPVAPAERAPVEEKVAPKATPKVVLKRRKELKFEKPTARPAAEEITHVSKPSLESKRKSQGVKSALQTEVARAVEHHLAGDFDKQSAQEAVDQAFAEKADEADSSQHDTIGDAIKALKGPITERAKALATEKTQERRRAAARAQAEETLGAQERARLEAERKLREGTGQEKERTGSEKGKSARGLLAEDERSWERRYLDSTADDARTKRIQELLRKRGALKGGNQKSPIKISERKAIKEKLDAFREEDRAQARAVLAEEQAKGPSEAERQAAREKELEEQTQALQKTEEERKTAEEEARARARAARHAEHDRQTKEALAAHPEPTAKDVGRMSFRQFESSARTRFAAFYQDLRSRIKSLPDNLSPNNSAAQNFLIEARRLLGKAKLSELTGDRLHDLVVLKTALEHMSPQEFYSQLNKADTDMRQAAAGYDSDEAFDLKEAQGDYTGRGSAVGELEEEAIDEMSPDDLKEFIADREAWAKNEVASDIEDWIDQELAMARRDAEARRHQVIAETHGIRTAYGEVNVLPTDVESLEDVLDVPVVPQGQGSRVRGWNWPGTQRRSLVGSATGDEEAAIRGRNTPSVFNLLRKQTDKLIRQRLANVPVYWVSDAEMRRLVNKSDWGSTTRGFWVEPSQAARADGAKGAIVMNKNIRRSAEEVAAVIRHEAIHGLSLYAIEENIDGAAEVMGNMLRYLKDRLDNQGQSFIHNDPGHPEYQYGLKNLAEFVAEAFSNPAFQEFLASQELPTSLRRQLGDHKLVGRQPTTFWDLFIKALSNILRISGFGTRGENYLEAVVRLSEPSLRDDAFLQEHATKGFLEDPVKAAASRSMAELRLPGGRYQLPGTQHLTANTTFGDELIANQVTSAYETVSNLADLPGVGQRFRATSNAVKTGTQMAQDTVPILGREDNPFFQIMDAVRKQGTQAKETMQHGDELVSRFMKLNAKTREALADLVNLATLHNVDPSQATPTNLSKKGLRHAQRRARHAVLRQQFMALPADAKKVFEDTREFYKKMQHDMVQQQVRTMLNEARAADTLPKLPPGITDQSLEKWVLGDPLANPPVSSGFDRIGTVKETQADKDHFAALGVLAPSFKQVVGLTVKDGFYSPLMRRGRYVVRAKQTVTVPKGAAMWGPNNDKLIFRTKAAFDAWAAAEENHQVVDPYTIYMKKDANGKWQRSSKQDGGKRFFVASPQTEYMERFEKLSDAKLRSEQLRQDPGYRDVTTPDLGKDFRHGSAETDILPAAQRKIIEDATKHIADQAVKDQVRRQLANSIMQTNVGTRIQQRQRKRRGVHGYDKDVVRAMADYNVSASNHIARLAARPEINQGRRKIEQEIEARKYATDGSNLILSQNLSSLDANLKRNETFDPGEPGSRFIHSLLALSFIKHLWSPANWIVNSMQPGVVTLPYLASRHGELRAPFALGRAYWDIGGRGQVVKGVRNLGRGKTNQIQTTDEILNTLTRGGHHDEVKMLQELIDLGLVNKDAGMELDANDIRRGAVGKGISTMAEYASRMPHMVEGINRTTTAIAAYRLARQDGKTHQEATNYAGDAVNDTQGDYAQTVAPALFKSPTARLLLQFKKYPQMMYRLLLRNARILAKPMKGESRKQAAKELLYLATSHVAVAGAAGAPFMEVAKIVALLANGLGLDDKDWEDWQNWFQMQIAKGLGGKTAEVLTHGVSRLAGIDLGARMGADSLLFFSQPKEMEEEAVKASAWDAVAGAPIGMIGDAFKGISNAVAGDWDKAVAAAPIPKVLTDIWKAGSGLSGNKKKASGIEIPGTQLNYREAMWRALGFQPARTAERFEYGGSGYKREQEKKVQADRNSLVQGWLNAGSGASRKAAWDAAREWNKTRPKGAKPITMDGLQKAKTKRAREARKAAQSEMEEQ